MVRVPGDSNAAHRRSAEFDAVVVLDAWSGVCDDGEDAGVAGGEVFALAAGEGGVDLVEGVVGDRTVVVDIGLRVDGGVEVVLKAYMPPDLGK